MKLIFFAPDLDLSWGQGIFHGGAIELGQLFIELAVREESFPEGVDSHLLMTET